MNVTGIFPLTKRINVLSIHICCPSPSVPPTILVFLLARPHWQSEGADVGEGAAVGEGAEVGDTKDKLFKKDKGKVKYFENIENNEES